MADFPNYCVIHLQVSIILLFPSRSDDSLALAHGKCVIQDIIPAIAKLRREYPFSMRLVFAPEFLNDMLYFNPDLDCTDISESDIFFEKLPFK